MKVKFNGVIEKRVGGCGSCGARKSEKKFVAVKEYYLPSGARRTFRAGQVAEVSDYDGSFLLTCTGFEKA